MQPQKRRVEAPKLCSALGFCHAASIRRETGAASPTTTGAEAGAAKLARCLLQQSWDVFEEPPEYDPTQPPFHLRRRSRVTELVVADGLVLALTQSGVCSVYEVGRRRRLCWLNVEADETVCSIFLNTHAASVIVVSLFSGEAKQALHCRSTPLASLRAGRPQDWRPLFEQEVLSHPGFVEFDGTSGVCLTLSADTRTHKVWSLASLAPGAAPLFQLGPSACVLDLKLSTGVALAQLRPAPGAPANTLPLALLDLADGRCVATWQVALEAGRGAADLELLEVFGGHVLLKEPGLPLYIHDLASGGVREVSAGEFGSPHTLLHSHINRTFLAFTDAGLRLWDFSGRALAHLASGSLISGAGISDVASTVFLTNAQDLLLAYSNTDSGSCMVRSGAGTPEGARLAAEDGASSGATPEAAGASAAGAVPAVPAAAHPTGCVLVWDLRRGQRVAVVAPPSTAPGADSCSKAAAAARRAMQTTSCIFYDELRLELYSGARDGRVHVWA